MRAGLQDHARTHIIRKRGPLLLRACPTRPGERVVMALFGALGGLVVSAALLVFGLRVGDRWIAVCGGVSSAVFMAAVALIGGAV